MEKYCSKCDNIMDENNNNCLYCSVQKNKENNLINSNNSLKKKVPGKGLSIAGMVLGIYNTYGSILNIFTLKYNIEQLSYYSNNTYISKTFITNVYLTVQIIFRVLLPILGLVLSYFGYRKHESNFNKSGLILNSVSLCIAICLFIYTMFIL